MKTSLIAICAMAILANAAQAETFSADVWVDNWFSLNAGGVQVMEDSVSITTERSFNAESFTFEAERPFVLALTMKDFKENDTGLEYIGTRRQQMGDGGAIMQLHDAKGDLVVVSDSDWQCLVVHKAPLDTACADEADPIAGEGTCGFETTDIPNGWDTVDFDASEWPSATVHQAKDVGPKEGYDDVTWDDTAQFMWGPDLKTDNTILCRMTVE